MGALRLVLGDQLSPTLSSLTDVADGDTILLCEVMAEATYVRHHPQKIAFLFAAMRHFAADLQAAGRSVRYVRLDDAGNSGDFSGEVRRAAQALAVDRIIVTEPGEYRLRQLFSGWPESLGLPVEIRPDTRFLCSIDAFNAWAEPQRQLRMEYFYRTMRRQHGLLMTAAGEPEGGQWNYDAENRAGLPKDFVAPPRLRHSRDAVTEAVLQLVKARFADHFGALESFDYAVTSTQAQQELDYFVAKLLPHFGTYQDAMAAGAPYLYHSRLSAYLNAGLLMPLEVCRQAEAAYQAGTVPLNAAEGFIRQILGWREYVRGIYWRHMPDYGTLNFFKTETPLPDFYWTGATKMACVAEAVRHTRDHAYSHHIQRLMVTGNFALLAGLDVRQVQEWYLAVYSDAYEWVEMPNTLGMALFGDGGIMASKPYAASGKYIHKMSNYCASCPYNPAQTLEDSACPFNALYWDFLGRNQALLRDNHRLRPVYATWEKFGAARQGGLQDKAAKILRSMAEGTL